MARLKVVAGCLIVMAMFFQVRNAGAQNLVVNGGFETSGRMMKGDGENTEIGGDAVSFRLVCYWLDAAEITNNIYRHGGRANFAFVDMHVESKEANWIIAHESTSDFWGY
jgi:prepilin-type processing-associated H-X9-DG protein